MRKMIEFNFKTTSGSVPIVVDTEQDETHEQTWARLIGDDEAVFITDVDGKLWIINMEEVQFVETSNLGE